MRDKLTRAWIQRARELYQTDDIEIDDDAVCSTGDDGGQWISAWVWVADAEMEGLR